MPQTHAQADAPEGTIELREFAGRLQKLLAAGLTGMKSVSEEDRFNFAMAAGSIVGGDVGHYVGVSEGAEASSFNPDAPIMGTPEQIREFTELMAMDAKESVAHMPARSQDILLKLFAEAVETAMDAKATERALGGRGRE